MKYTFIEPTNSWPTALLNEKIQKASLKLRLDISLASAHQLDQAMLDLAAHNERGLDTIVAVGSPGWFDQVVSVSLRTFSRTKLAMPVFAHLPTPRFFPGANRLPSYLDTHLQRGLSAIAARKIFEQPVYVCGGEIWFLHSLELNREATAVPTRISIATPGDGKISIQASPEKLRISAEHTILDQTNHHLTILAQQRQITNQPKRADVGFMQTIQKKVDTYLYEDIFHLPATSLVIESPQGYHADEFGVTLPPKVTIRSADFKARCIVPKNDISKY